MPPKTVFNEEEVVNAAFELAIEGGINILSARKIAEKLHSSTAPVYSTFESMDLLKEAVLKRAKNLMFEYATRSYTSSIFLNMGTGYALFARDYKQLYRSIFLDNDGTTEMLHDFMSNLTDEMIKDDMMKHLPQEEQNSVMERMSIFTHGYAAFICAGFMKDVSKQDVIKAMYDMGRDVIGHALYRNGKEEYINQKEQ
jgi:AcrR family transcriptional regulator